MTETADKYADLAKTAGASAGLTQEQIPGLAHILRELARSERAEQKEACARVADEHARKNRVLSDEEAHAAELIAAAIRALGR